MKHAVAAIAIVLLLQILIGFYYYTQFLAVSITDIKPCIEYSFNISSECKSELQKDFQKTDHILLIVVDAMGWNVYSRHNPFPEISSMGKIYKAKTVLPLMTKEAHLSLFSGSADRNKKQIFEILSEKNLSSLVIASERFFNTVRINATTVAPPDIDNDGIAGDDDDVAEKTLELLKENPNFVFAHLSIDYTSHRYGPYSEEAKKDLIKMGMLIKKIVSALPAEWLIIITADHGQHQCFEQQLRGCHGSSRQEDVEIPIILASKKNLNM